MRISVRQLLRGRLLLRNFAGRHEDLATIQWLRLRVAKVVGGGRVQWHDWVVHPLLLLHGNRVGGGLPVVDAEALAVEGEMTSVARDIVRRLLLEGVRVIKVARHGPCRGRVLSSEVGTIS